MATNDTIRSLALPSPRTSTCSAASTGLMLLVQTRHAISAGMDNDVCPSGSGPLKTDHTSDSRTRFQAQLDRPVV